MDYRVSFTCCLPSLSPDTPEPHSPGIHGDRLPARPPWPLKTAAAPARPTRCALWATGFWFRRRSAGQGNQVSLTRTPVHLFPASQRNSSATQRRRTRSTVAAPIRPQHPRLSCPLPLGTHRSARVGLLISCPTALGHQALQFLPLPPHSVAPGTSWLASLFLPQPNLFATFPHSISHLSFQC